MDVQWAVLGVPIYNTDSQWTPNNQWAILYGSQLSINNENYESVKRRMAVTQDFKFSASIGHFQTTLWR